MRDRSRRWAALLVAVCAVATAPACGGGEETAISPAPPKVPVEIVPPTLGDGTLALGEDETAREAFATVGPQALVADGRLWAIRVGHTDRLVGTLQVSTVKSKVELSDEDHRQSLINEIIPGAKESITVGQMDVVQTSGEDKVVYVWFGMDLFQVLQLKPSSQDPIEPELVLAELIGFQTSQPEWKGLTSGSIEDDGDEEG